jgi:polyphosphate kinase 2 (PPK2 family)
MLAVDRIGRYLAGMKDRQKAKPPRLEDVDLGQKLPGRKEYERKLAAQQLLLLEIQQAYMRQRRRGIVVLEGWDTAGKGGLVRRMSARLDPRYLSVWPISAPSAEEQGRHYLYRFWMRLPAPGSIALFDRSWYGRVLVERVESLALENEWRRAYGEINAFERMLTDDGVRLVKLFLHITPEEQLRRFQERLSVPYKRWKLTMDDLRNRARWGDYEVAVDDMLKLTDTAWAPWHVIPINYKWYGRVRALKTITKVLSRGINLDAPSGDPKIAAAIKAMNSAPPQ